MLVQERGGEKSRTQPKRGTFFSFSFRAQRSHGTGDLGYKKRTHVKGNIGRVLNQTATQNERCELERSWNALKEEVNALLKTMDVKEQTMKQPDAEHKVLANDLNKMLKVLKDEANTTKQLQLLNDLQKQIELLLAIVNRTVNTQILPSQTSIYVY